MSGAVILTIGLAAGIAHGATPPPPHTGHASVTIQLPRVTLTDPTGAAHTVTLGSLGARARTDAGSAASLGLGGASLLGTALPGWQVDTANGSQSGDHHVPLAAGTVTGGLDLLSYAVDHTSTSARAALNALTGSVTTTPLDLHVALGQHGLAAAVRPTTTRGAIGMTVRGLRLGLGDLLPANVLAALPLSTLLDITSVLGQPLPAGAGTVLTELRSIADQLQAIEQAASSLAAAQSSLAALLAGLPSTAAAQQQLTAAQTQLATDLATLQAAQQQLGTDTATAQALQTQVDSVTAQLANPLLTPQQIATLTAQLTTLQTQLTQANATVAADQAAVTSDQQQVATDQAAVAAAQQALDALVATITNNQAVATAEALVTQLTSTLTSLITTLTGDLAALPDLSQLHDQLVTLLNGAPLLDVGTVGATLSSTANDHAGSGTVTCTVSGASVLGHAVPVGSCSDLVSRFAQVRSALGNVFDQLAPQVAVTPVLDGLAQSTSGSTPTATHRVTKAAAGLTPLHLAIPQASLGALSDAVVSRVLGLLGPVETTLAQVAGPTVVSTLTGSLGSLSTVLSALPTGAALANLRTVGVDVALVGLSTTAVHYLAHPVPAAGHPTPHSGQVTPPTSVPSATPSVQQSPAPSLPFTGNYAAIEIALAAVLALAGAHLVVGGRRRTPVGPATTLPRWISR